MTLFRLDGDGGSPRFAALGFRVSLKDDRSEIDARGN